MNYIGDIFLHQIYREVHFVKMVPLPRDIIHLIYSYTSGIKLGTFNFFYCTKIE